MGTAAETVILGRKLRILARDVLAVPDASKNSRRLQTILVSNADF